MVVTLPEGGGTRWICDGLRDSSLVLRPLRSVNESAGQLMIIPAPH